MTLPAGHWALGPIAVLDTETTGLDPGRGDRIIELAVVHFDGGVVSDRWGVLVDPHAPLPQDIKTITGIQDADVAGQPDFAAVAEEFLARLRGRLIAAYNVPFDRGFILHELARCGRALPEEAVWIDPLVLAKALQKGQGKMKLGLVAQRLGVPLEEAHRATADAECAGAVLQALAALLPADLGEALDLHETWEAQQHAAKAAWRQRPGQTIAVDSGQRHDDGLGASYPHGDELDPIRAMFLRGLGRS